MIAAAFILGFVGSLHCAAMCGPLVLAMPVVGSSRHAIILSRVIYNAGRVSAYAVIGLFFGLVGKSLLLAGFQRWLSIGAGVVMLILLITSRKGANHAGWRAAALIKTTFRSFLQKRSYGAVFALGAANGLLPCGLVYLAGTAAAAAGEPAGASIYMIVFGFGTFPMMLGLGIFGPAMAKALQRFRLGVLVPVAVSLVALSLILRGLALGIPYLSPSVADGHVECSACAD